jgi:flagellar hook-associated protein 3 FlgL
MRVTQETFYRQTMYNLLRMRYGEYVMNNQAASAKRINSPSEDPVGSISAQGSHRMMEEIDQYTSTVQHTRDWLRQADSSMQSMSDYLAQIKAKAEQASTGTYTSSQLDLIGKDALVMMSHLVGLGNSQVDGKYIFAGAKNNLPAINTDPKVQSPALASTANNINSTGSLYGQGDFTGRKSRLVTVAVDSVTAGGTPMDVSYSYVDDFGRTISGKTSIGGVGTAFACDVGDGAQVYVDQGTYAVGDSFTLTIGRNNGDDQELNANLSWNYRLRYNFALGDLYGQEGYANGQWNNTLDLLADWQDALTKDSQTQDYFETVAGRYNNPGSGAKVQVDGDFAQLKSAQMQFQAGGPIQFRVNDPAVTDATVQGRYYQFYLDPTSNTGAPSATNPVTLHYAYWSGAAWVDGGTLNVTDTGPENPVTLPDNGGQVSIVLPQSTFDANTMTTFAALPTVNPTLLPVDNPGIPFSFYADKTAPSAGTPVDFTYSYNDGANERRHGTITFTGTGGDYAWNVPLNVAPLNVASNVDAATLQNRQYEFYLTPNSNTGTPSAANPITLVYRYKDASGAWVDPTPNPGYPPPPEFLSNTLTITGTGPENMAELTAANPGEKVRIFLADGAYDANNVATWPPGTTNAATLTMDFAGPRSTVTLAAGGTVDDGDYYSATLEQYHQGQALSQTTLARMTGLQANLLKYLGDAGARLDNMDVRDNLLESDNVRLQDRLAKVEDADVTKVTTNLTLYQTLYQATLQATAMVTSKSLADYL